MLKPVQLYRRWRDAAGPLFGMNVPAAPFSEIGAIMNLSKHDAAQPRADELCHSIAVTLANSETGELVKAGAAAFVLDLPGFISVGTGAYLQAEGIAPVLLLASFYYANAFIDGRASLPNLAYYGAMLGGYSEEKGLAFLLERERLPYPEPDKLAIIAQFDNRYALGEKYFPPFEALQRNGIRALVDVRPLGEEVLPDLFDYYELAAEAGFDIYSTRLNIPFK
jgi:hypothetical protein